MDLNIEHHNDSISANDLDMAVSLARIETIVQRLESRLLGNGQPGEIDKLDKRTTSLESVAYKAKGAFWAFSALITSLGGALLQHLWKGR